ncbi:MAG TPA: formate/nitrite transporter family protein [Candidatus Wunengus sp. YC65]|uniref:formate/nitrite transporter family protein n=1 Tax=Candidatus Wunengus sp. YC65 TaxID=3367701 RepID=UPI00402995C7
MAEERNFTKNMQTMNTDTAYSPPQTAAIVENKAAVRAKLRVTQTFALSIMAGIFVALGAQFATFVTSDSTLHFGLTSLIAGVVFSLGLILVETAGAELFTGNNLNVLGYLSNRITPGELLRIWVIVYIGNFIGSLLMVCCMYKTHQFEFFHNMVGAKALLIAHKKVNLSFTEALARGVLCNALVCLNAWLCYSGRTLADKVLSVIFPIGGFVASGFEHCVANMYFIPIGMVLRKNPAVVAAAEKMAGKTLDLSQLTWKGFFINNLIPVTLGNFIGGVILIGTVCWFIYLRPDIHFLSLNIKSDFPKRNKQ